MTFASLEAAGRRRSLPAGARLYDQGDRAETIFLLISGLVELRTARAGQTLPSAIRSVRRAERFGEECVLDGARRASSALAVEPSVVVEVPLAVYRRLAAQGGELEHDEPRLRRVLCRDALSASFFGQALSARDVEDIAAELSLVRVARGERLYESGDVAAEGFVLAEGLVRLDTGAGGVFAYLGRGDLFGDEEALGAARRELTATALGDSVCLGFSRATLRRIDRGYPGLLLRARRVFAGRRTRQLEVVSEAEARSTQHVFKDLYRLQIARSLLAIDLDRCVRCGHCAQACADVHGVSRLVRRGDKVITKLATAPEGPEVDLLPKSLLLPNSCQHCASAACMIDCPTGAIGREANGEVFIREDLCTGCGACAKACPWENVQMAPRAAPAGGASTEVAVKCDLCGSRGEPACVTACPTEAIARVDPNEAFVEVRALFGRERAQRPKPERRTPAWASWLGGGAVIGLVGGLAFLGRAAALDPAKGVGLACGVVAAVLCLLTFAYALPKRAVGWWLRVRARGGQLGAAARAAGMRRLLGAHAVLGAAALVAIFGHAGLGSTRGASLPLSVSLWIVLISGALSGVAYRFVPKRLTPLEPTGLLPEDFPAERQRLLERLESGTSRRSAVVKALVSKLLLPYARSAGSVLGLTGARQGLRGEERRIRAKVDAVLPRHAADRLEGLEPLIRAAVELAALRGRTILSALLRGLPLVHFVSSLVFVLLLLAHVLAVSAARLRLWGL